MSRRNLVLRIRYKNDSDGIRSSLVSGNGRGLSNKLSRNGNKILRVEKVSMEERLRTGEFFPAAQLLKQLRKEAESKSKDLY